MGKGPEDLVVVEGVSRLSRLSTTLRAAPDGCRGERVTWKLLVSATKGVLSRISKVPPSCPLQRSTILLTLGPFSSPRNPFTRGFLARDIVIRRCFIHRRVFWYFFFFFLSSSHRGIYLVCCRIDACTIHTRRVTRHCRRREFSGTLEMMTVDDETWVFVEINIKLSI